MKDNQTANLSLDLTYYPGKNLYTDGAIEDEILAFVRDNPPSAYEEYIAKRKNWDISLYGRLMQSFITTKVKTVNTKIILIKKRVL